MGVCLGRSLASVQLCGAAAGGTNVVETVWERGSVLLLAFFREEQKLAYCLMKETPSFYVCFSETG